jgi:hypothetical protein
MNNLLVILILLPLLFLNNNVECQTVCPTPCLNGTNCVIEVPKCLLLIYEDRGAYWKRGEKEIQIFISETNKYINRNTGGDSLVEIKYTGAIDAATYTGFIVDSIVKNQQEYKVFPYGKQKISF